MISHPSLPRPLDLRQGTEMDGVKVQFLSAATCRVSTHPVEVVAPPGRALECTWQLGRKLLRDGEGQKLTKEQPVVSATWAEGRMTTFWSLFTDHAAMSRPSSAGTKDKYGAQ